MFGMIDRVAEMATGKIWEKALEMNVYEFLSIYSYSVEKQQYQERMIKAENDKMRARIKSGTKPRRY